MQILKNGFIWVYVLDIKEIRRMILMYIYIYTKKHRMGVFFLICCHNNLLFPFIFCYLVRQFIWGVFWLFSVYINIKLPGKEDFKRRGVMVKAMDFRIVVCEFEFKSRYYVHFRTNTLRKWYEPPYPPSYGLNSITTILLESWL